MPESIIKRANEILKYYEKNNKNNSENEQITFVLEEEQPNKLKERLAEIDPLKITPLEAMNILYELKQTSKED